VILRCVRQLFWREPQERKRVNRGKPAIWAEGLRKSYGKTLALDGLDLRVEEGTILGLLGPNGAGKTTVVRILTTLLSPDAGRGRRSRRRAACR